MRRSGGARVVRGSLAASVATFVALLSHVSAGGAVPGPLGLLVPFVLSVFVCTVLAGPRLSAIRLSLAVTGSQALFHSLFVLGVVSTGAPRLVTGHDHAAVPSPATGAVLPATGALLPATDGRMLLWHLLAAALTTAALYRGERAARRLRALAAEALAWLRRWVPSLLAEQSPAPRRAPIDVPRDHRVGDLVSPRANGRRGPPVALAA
ncbi:hypothetical protein F6J84_14550 [Microbacterium caowuchunii]|uniref:hypothetical protein n=1 Tax=Microbacterium caowuchunii TaxID=2614638 RepID=UPI001246CDEF|nr:hypothetical protein [Microbacterium caowuchunii]QEW01196.1 hypothetical protein F6J84_14550 [Microbacterium caowuchunii]